LSQERGKLAGEMRETAMFAAAAAAPFIASARTAASFEDRIKDIAITGGFSRAEEAGVGNAVRQAALRWNQTQEEIAAGLSVLTAGGISEAKALEQYAPAFARVATATRASMEELAASSIALKDNLSIGAEDIEAALNQMHYAGKEGQFEMRDMAKWFPALTPMLQSLGMEGKDAVAELAAALQIARKGAGSNDEAANNLKNFLAKITAPDTIKKFDEAGIDIKARMEEMTGRGMSPMMAMLENVRAYMSGMGPKVAGELQAAMELKNETERQAALDRLSEAYRLGEIFRDMQAMSFIRPALANREEFERIKAGALAAKNQDIIGEDFQKRMEGAQEQWKFFRIHIMEVAITIGDALLPALNNIIAAILPAIRWMGEFAKAHPGIVKLFAAFLVGVTGIRLGLLGLKWGWNFAVLTPINAVEKAVAMLRAKWALLQGMWLTGKFASITRVFARFSSGLKTMGAWLAVQGRALFTAFWLSVTGPGASLSKTLFAPFRLIGQGILWLSRLMLTTPVGLIITGIALAAFLIYKYWRPIKAFFAGVWEGILSVMGPVVESIRTEMAPVFALLFEIFAEIKTLIGPLIDEFWALIAPTGEAGEAVKNVGVFIGIMLGTAIKAVIWSLARLAQGFLMVAKVGMAAFKVLAPFVKSVWAEIHTAFSGGLSSIALLIVNWSPLGLFYRAFAGALSWFGIELPGKFTEFGGMIVDGLISGIDAALGRLKEKVKALGDMLPQGLREKWDIASPSKVMMEIGGFAMRGLELGMAGGQEGPLSIISRLSGGILSAIRAPLAHLGNLMAMPPLQPMPALAGAGGGPILANGNQMSAPSAGLTVNIVVNPAPGMDEKKLAFLVAQKLKEAQLGKEARARSRLVDSD
jgi:hypothetical protein